MEQPEQINVSAALLAAIDEVDKAAGISIHGKSYKQVAARVLAFRKHFGTTGRLRVAECMENPDGRISMRAVVELAFPDPRAEGGFAWLAVAEGRAEEVRGSSSITKTSAMEVCETSAYGRALANLGLHGGEFASANEVENAISKGDRSGRPDTSGVDQELVKSYKANLTKALQNADKETILEDHKALRGQEALYSAVWDNLSSKQRTDLRAIIAEANKS